MQETKFGQMHQVTSATASALIKTGPGRVMGVQIYSPTNVNGKVELKDALTDTGTARVTLGQGGVTNGFGGSHPEDYSALGGISYTTGIYCTITGSGVLCTIWYE
jgi:hypothetical protein